MRIAGPNTFRSEAALYLKTGRPDLLALSQLNAEREARIAQDPSSSFFIPMLALLGPPQANSKPARKKKIKADLAEALKHMLEKLKNPKKLDEERKEALSKLALALPEWAREYLVVRKNLKIDDLLPIMRNIRLALPKSNRYFLKLLERAKPENLIEYSDILASLVDDRFSAEQVLALFSSSSVSLLQKIQPLLVTLIKYHGGEAVYRRLEWIKPKELCAFDSVLAKLVFAGVEHEQIFFSLKKLKVDQLKQLDQTLAALVNYQNQSEEVLSLLEEHEIKDFSELNSTYKELILRLDTRKGLLALANKAPELSGYLNWPFFQQLIIRGEENEALHLLQNNPALLIRSFLRPINEVTSQIQETAAKQDRTELLSQIASSMLLGRLSEESGIILDNQKLAALREELLPKLRPLSESELIIITEKLQNPLGIFREEFAVLDFNKEGSSLTLTNFSGLGTIWTNTLKKKHAEIWQEIHDKGEIAVAPILEIEDSLEKENLDVHSRYCGISLAAFKSSYKNTLFSKTLLDELLKQRQKMIEYLKETGVDHGHNRQSSDRFTHDYNLTIEFIRADYLNSRKKLGENINSIAYSEENFSLDPYQWFEETGQWVPVLRLIDWDQARRVK